MSKAEVTQREIKESRARLWHMGILTWKLDITQRAIYDFFHGNPNSTTTVNASRRLGKSFFLLIIAFEICLKKPGAIVVYVQPKTGMMRKNLRPSVEKIIEDCPLELRPEFKSQDNVWEFPNGSKISLAGTDNQNYDKLRGGDADLCIIDEAGFCSDLKHIIDSILGPLITLTEGKIILSSTTSTDPDHEFNQYMDTAEIEGTLIRKTLLDAIEEHKKEPFPRITERTLEQTLKRYKTREKDQAFRTEYLCEKVFNSTDAVLPEFTLEVQTDTIVEWPRPIFYDRYTAMDIGFVDLTVVLAAYWDYGNNVLVVEDEFVGNGPDLTTPTLGRAIKELEKKVWANQATKEVPDMYRRVSDNNLRVISDLSVENAIHFIPTEKHEKQFWISTLREMIERRQIIINPRCKTLISHMRGATWDKPRKDFKRHTSGHHYDAVAALLYLSRNIDKTRSPYPAGYRYSQLGKSSEVFINPNNQKQEFNNPEYQKIKEMFTRKSTFNKRVAK